MAIIDVQPYATRTTVTLSADEVWQVRGGGVRVQTAAPSSEDDGVDLTAGTALQFKSGTPVTVWRTSGVGAQVARMAV